MKCLTSAARALLESDRRFMESAAVLSVPDATPMKPEDWYVRGGHVARVVLITEGLGNRRNMNYYGPEAIASAPAVFEGKPCFLNHPSETEERDIPERRVQDKFGYFKNCRVETVDGLRACTGELHFDLSEAGYQAFQKSCTALQFRKDFPGLDAEYVGLSIYADGDWEDRTVQWEGESLQVKYVTRFTDAVSCDLVTTPARGGRILALVESAAGAMRQAAAATPTKEVGPMQKKLTKLMEAARTALKNADEEKDPAKKSELIAEARKLNDKFLSEASKAVYAGEDKPEEKGDDAAAEAAKADAAKVESAKADAAKAESAKGETSAEESKGDMCAKDKESDDEMDESKGDEADDAPKPKKKAAKKKADDEDEDDDTVEATRIAVASLLKESGVIVGEKRAAALAKLSLKEAKEEIELLAEDQQVLVKSVLKQMNVPAAHFGKTLTESDRDGAPETNNHLFADCFRR